MIEADEQTEKKPNGKKILFGILTIPAVVLFVAVFYKVLFTDAQFCYRDTGVFYYPLYHLIQSEWNAGRFPLWNPYENLGQPLFANPVSAIFYPGKLIFLPTIFFPNSFDVCFKIFILFHFTVAYAGMYRLVRRWKQTQAAAALSAFVYIFCVPVFFQYTNPIYFAGAAWFPWAILEGNRVLQTKSAGAVLKLGIVLAMMVLAGDPMSPYFIGLLLLGLCWIYHRGERLSAGSKIELSGAPKKPKRASVGRWQRLKQLSRSRVGLLFWGAVIAAALSSVTIISSGKMEKQTNRLLKSAPTSLWELPTFLTTGKMSFSGPSPNKMTTSDFLADQSRFSRAISGLFCKNFQYEGHHQSAYKFSLTPWSPVEMFWPNFGGDVFSGHPTRWFGKLPNTYMWIPSLYMGIIPLVLALSVFHLRRKNISSNADATFAEQVIRWASWGAVLTFWGALGAFGLIWFCRAALWLLGIPQDLVFHNGDPVGGLYWWMNLLLPKFASFRYPGKLAPACFFCLAVLAGFGWDHLTVRRRLAAQIAGVLLGLSLVGWVIFEMVGPKALQSLQSCTDILYGRMDLELTIRIVRCSFLQPMIVLGIFLLLLRFFQKESLRKTFFAFCVLLLCAADLFVLLREYVPTLPAEEMRGRMVMEDILLKGKPAVDADGKLSPPVRCYDLDTVQPALFQFSSSYNRDAELYRWYFQNLSSNTAFMRRIGYVPAPGSMYSADLFLIRNWLTSLDMKGPKERALVVQFLAALDCQYFTLASNILRPFSNTTIVEGNFMSGFTPKQQIDELNRLDKLQWPLNVVLLQNDTPTARVRIVRRPSRPETSNRFAALREQFRLFAPDLSEREYAKITEYLPNRLTLEVALDKPSEVILAEQYWPGWQAKVFPKSGGKPFAVKIKQDKNCIVLRSLSMPAGEYRIEMAYRPFEVYFGMTTSLLAWIALSVAWFRLRKKPVRF